MGYVNFAIVLNMIFDEIFFGASNQDCSSALSYEMKASH